MLTIPFPFLPAPGHLPFQVIPGQYDKKDQHGCHRQCPLRDAVYGTCPDDGMDKDVGAECKQAYLTRRAKNPTVHMYFSFPVTSLILPYKSPAVQR